MPIKQGVVEYCGYKNVNKKAGGTTQIWSFKVDGDFYSCSFEKPLRPDGVRLLAGDKVKFNFEPNQYGLQVDMKSLQVKMVADPADAPKEGGGGSAGKKSYGGGGNKKFSGGGGGARDDYWAKKEQYDKETTQPLILFQSANNIAKDMVIAALDKDLLPLPAKKAEKFPAFVQCQKQLQKEIYAELLATYKKLGGPDVSELLGLQNVDDDDAPFDKSVDELEEMEGKDTTFADMEDADDWD